MSASSTSSISVSLLTPPALVVSAVEGDM
jgi:hypothetical protein